MRQRNWRGIGEWWISKRGGDRIMWIERRTKGQEEKIQKRSE